MISGTVTYGNAIGAPAQRFISNVTIAGDGSPTVMTTTGEPGPTAGQYLLAGFGSGSYTVTPSKTDGVNNVTSFDAARIAQHVTGNGVLTGNQLIVADVSGNGNISSFDAAEVAKYVVASAPFGSTGTWIFSPVNRMYSSVTGSITGEDYSALLMGEVSGNWTNPGARLGDRGGSSGGRNAPERGIELDAPRLALSADKKFVVPIEVAGAANKGIISYEFDLSFDPSVIQPLSEPVNVVGTVSRGLFVVTNAEKPGLLRVVMYGPMPIDADGLLLNLRFQAVGLAGSVSPLTWERIMFNEGAPRATAVDGQVELSNQLIVDN